MLQKKNQLFRILETLSPPEKSYIKKFGYASSKDDTLILKLLSIIEQEAKKGYEDIDEKVLEKKLLKANKEANYAQTKARLLRLVLDSIRKYDKSNDDLQRLFDYISMHESLFRRKLFFDAQQMLEKAEKLALELEEIELLLKIKLQLFQTYSYTQKYGIQELKEHKAALWYPEEEVALLKEKIDCTQGMLSISHFQKALGIARSKEDLLLFQELSDFPALQENYDCNTVTNTLQRCTAMSAMYVMQNRQDKVIEICEATIERFNPSSKIAKKVNTRYIGLLDILMQACLMSLQIARFEKHYQHFLNIEVYSHADTSMKACIGLFANCMYAILSKKTNSFAELHNQFQHIREDHFVPNYRKVSISFYLVFGNFLNENYALAKESINWLQQNQNLGIRADIESAVLSMELLILLEEEEFYYMDNRIRTVNDTLRQKDRKFELESLLTRFVQKAKNKRAKPEMDKLLQLSLAEIKTIVKNNPTEQQYLDAFDLASWMEAKISGEKFQQLYYRNNNL